MRPAELRRAARLTLWSPLWRARAELLTSGAIIGGWAAVTAGVVGFFPSHIEAIWRLSIGALLLSLAGWRFVGFVAMRGLYTLTRGKNA